MSIATVNPTQATYVYGLQTGNNYSGESKVRLGYMANASAKLITLLDFDLAFLSGATINSGTLRLYSYDTGDDYGSRATSLGVKRLLSEWDAATVTYATKPTEDSTYQGTESWSGYNKWYEWDVAAILQAIANGAVNYGVSVQQTTAYSQATSKSFYKNDTTYKPQLVIDYTPGCFYYDGTDFIPCSVYVGSTPADIYAY